MQRLISFICLVSLLSPGIAQAECAQITPIKKDQVAACDGVLIRSDAVPSVIVNLTSAEEKCKFRLKEQQEKSDAWCTAEKDKLKAQIEVQKELSDKRLKIRQEQIDFLTEEIKRLKTLQQERLKLTNESSLSSSPTPSESSSDPQK